MKAYREWLPAHSWEGIASLGGSFYSDNIEDYYLTPYDLGYGSMVKFDHDFVGREALETISKNPKRTKVTLALDTAGVMKALGTMFEKGDRAKYMDFPSAVYSTWPYDKVTKNGKTIGISTWVGYSANEGKMLTLAILDNEHAHNGNEVTYVLEGGYVADGQVYGPGSRIEVTSAVKHSYQATPARDLVIAVLHRGVEML